MAGKFIVIEGPNKAGKSTLIKELDGYLKSVGREIVTVREPGGTPLGEQLRLILKSPTIEMSNFASALLMEASREQLCYDVINPSVATGKIVLCDRYYFSTDIFQMILKRMDEEREYALTDIHNTFPQPDLVIFLIPSQHILDLRSPNLIKSSPPEDRFEGNSQERQAYINYANTYKHNKIIIQYTICDNFNILRDIVTDENFLKVVKI